MRIKKLELIGFKSFKDRTVIQFDAGITGVVGPNGCGKSNIVDALVWVMGEMSAKHLRGSSMEDVIFAGSDGYSPQGMAEVSLVLENDGGPFPAKYTKLSELMVTRRLHRSGESEYLINKEAARLRDIQEIFMDTGAGSKGFSIIEQGAIGKIITAKPDERRTLIEEAAGITKFKVRKRESVRKLTATDQNLVRLQDIIGELKRQLASLERQAKRAQRYREIKDQVKELDLWLTSLSYFKLHKDYEEAKSIHDEAQAEEIEAQAAVGIIEADLASQRVELSNKENELNHCQSRHLQALNRVQEKEKEIMELNFRIEQGHENEKKADTLVAEHQARREFLERDSSDLKQKMDALQVDVDKLRVDFDERSLKLTEAEQKLSSLDETISNQRRELLAIDQSRVHLEAEANMAKSKINELDERLNEAEKVREELASKKYEFEVREKKVSESLEGEKQLQLQIMQDVETFTSNFELVEQEVATRQGDVENFKDELNKVTSRLYGLEDLHNNFEGFEEGVRTVMFWQKKKEAQMHADGSVSADSMSTGYKAFQPVADVVEVPGKYEMAMEAALGVRLQVLLGKDQSQALEAVDYLKECEKGRSSFLTTDNFDLESKACEQKPSGDGVEAILRDVVTAPEAYESQVNFLTGSVAIVDNVRTALRLRPTYPGWSFVTLEGDTLTAEGLLTGGTDKDVESGVLKRKREIKELRGRKEEWMGKLSLAQLTLQKKEAQLKTLKEDLEAASKKNNEKEILLTELRKDLERAETELQNVIKAFDQQLKDCDKLSEQLSDQKEKLTTCEESLVESKARSQTLESEIKLQISSLETEKQAFESERSEVMNLRVQVVGSSQELEGYKRQYEMLSQSLQEVIERLDRVSEESKQNAENLTSNQKNLAEKNVTLDQLVEATKEAEGLYSKIQDEFQQAQSIIKELEGRAHEKNSAVNKYQMQVNDAQLKMDQTRIQETYLIDGIKERYSENLESRADEFAKRQGDVEASTVELNELKSKLSKLGDVNISAVEEYNELEDRYNFLSKQHEDLIAAKDQLRKVIDRINRICTRRFKETFEAVNERFSRVFPVLFGGGEAKLLLIESVDDSELGIDIVAKPPGKKMQNVTLMSGGEKALTAVALIFSIFLVKPSPYCLLDEVDAPLDDANVARFNDLVKEMAKRSQIILVTHNKHTMAVNDKLYGVTMEEKGVSKMVSVSLEEAQSTVS